MRRRAVVAVVAIVCSFAPVTSSTPVAAAPAGCRSNANGIVEFCDQAISTPGGRGSIALLGDSVLLGSANGMSNPGLPTMLATAGWGPIRFSTSLGMITYTSTVSKRDGSAFHWISRWKAAGLDPGVIAINVGANHLGTCTPSTVAACTAKIDQLLNEIQRVYPNALVWWAKIVQRLYPSGAYSNGMLGWNLALDQAAAARPNLIVWDWPTALATANPPITTDLGSIHPVSGAEYVKRSTLIADHLALQRSAARFVGPRAPLPSAEPALLDYRPLAQTAAYDTRLTGNAFAAGETRAIPLAERLGADALGASLTVGAVGLTANGYLRVYRCGDPPPATSNVNFAAGVVRHAQVLTRVTAAGEVCIYSNVAAHVVVSTHGSFVASGGLRLTTFVPGRLLDTRNTGRAADIVIPTPGVGAVTVNITATGPSAGGTVTVSSCDDVANGVVNVAFLANETVAGSAFVRAVNGAICVRVATGDASLADVLIDLSGVFTTDGSLQYQPAVAQRLLDTRIGLGGWVGRHGKGQVLDVVAAPAGAAAVTGTLTIVRPAFNGHLRSYPCAAGVPTTSSVNARAGTVTANSVTVGIDGAQRVCLYSSQSTQTVFDVVGWWVGPA